MTAGGGERGREIGRDRESEEIEATFRDPLPPSTSSLPPFLLPSFFLGPL
jgi:hypothetical protein